MTILDHEKLKTGRGEILIVDDTPANLQLLTEILAEQGYAVRAASSGRLALRSVAAKAPHLILLDVKMPQMDGFEVCRRLKAEERSREIPVIFISALDETVDKVKGFEAGGVDYISKPFQPEEVLARIGVQLRIRQLTDKLQEANETLEFRVEERTAELAKANAELEAEIAERLKTQQALEESEKLFRSFFKASAAGMAIIAPDGRFLEVNQAQCDYLGYARDEMIGRTVEAVTHPDDREATHQLYLGLQAGERSDIVYEKRYLRKDGTLVWGHASVAPVFDTAGRLDYYVALVQNISRRKQAEEAVSESERRRAILMANLPGMVYRCRNDRDWTMEFVSEGCRALTGYAPEDLLESTGRSYNDLIHPDDREWLWQYVQSSVKEEQPFELEYRIRTAGEEERWVWERGRGVFGQGGELLALEGFITDVTERKEAKEALQQSEERLSLALQVSNEGVWDWSLATDEVYFSPRYFTMLGYAPAEFPPSFKTFARLLHPDDREGTVARARVLVEKGENFHMEFRMVARDGRSVHVLSRGEAVAFDAAGRPTRLVGTHMDITERKEAEEALRYREAFESLIAEVSTRFVELPPAEAGAGIDFALRKLGAFVGVDRCCVIESSSDDSAWSETHAWCAPGIPAMRNHRQGTDVGKVPWGTARIRNRQFVHVPRVADLPPAAAKEKARWQAQGIKSVLCVPIYFAAEVVGVLTLETVREEKNWSEQDLTLHRTVGEIFGSALIRQRAEQERERLLHDMGERIKEFRGLYGMSQLLRRDEPLETLFREAVTLIPPSWHYPEITRAQLRFDDREYVSSPFDATPWMQSAEIVVQGQCRGTLKVYYLEERPTLDEGPFLQEERQLLDTLARNLGETIERKCAQEALRESEERFRSIFVSTTTPMAILSPSGDVQQVNPACCRFFGYSEEEFCRLNVKDVTHPDDRPRTVALYHEVSIGQRGGLDYEKRYLCKDGTIRWGHTTMAPVTDEQGQVSYFVALTQDVTDRKQAEEALLSAHRRLEDIIEFLPDATFVIDGEKKVAAWNRAMEKMTGVGKNEVLGQGDYAYALPFYGTRRPILIDLVGSQNPEFEANYDFVKRRGDTLIAETPLPSLYEGRGGYLWGIAAPLLDQQGHIVGAIESIRDITDRKEAEGALKAVLAEAEEAREKIDAILKSVADGLVVADLSGRVALMNRAAEKQLGMTLGEAFSRPVDTLLPGEGFGAQVAAVLEGGGHPPVLEWELTDQTSAKTRTIQPHTAAVQNREGKTTGTITLLRDVTRERELDRMKNEFISTAAHELRTPLTSVLGYSEVLLNQEEYGITDPALQKEFLDAIHAKGQRLEAIISDLLDLSRIQSGQRISLQRSPCDIVQLLDKIVSQYRQEKDGYPFEVSLPEGAVELWVDAGKIEQVMDNLLGNAVKFSQQNGTIRVTGQVTGDSFLIVVADEGIGMTPEQLERVFDKFYRVDASDTAAGGLGLGMSIAKSIVEAHGGEIRVESEPGQGTKVRVTIPLGKVISNP
ncbi:PAS domain S-box protein [Desulfuromonas sp.]|uniref:PAS domain S-box protein n=1 Tax=Desulfuromonas sp. TaxID=892 RepID=UPI0025C30530|nr:PAS domain S-box protein [Desulfuromonas sp.]